MPDRRAPYDEYDAFAAAYDKHWGFFADAIRPVLDRLALSGLADGETIIDLCCGAGHLAASLSDRFDVIGIDGSGAMIQLARGKAPLARFIVADARDFSVDTPAAAAISTFDSLNHVMTLDDLTEVFSRVRAALSHGGTFIFDLNMERGYEERWGSGSWMSGDDRIEVEGTWDPVARIGTADITVTPGDPNDEAVHVRLTQRCYEQEDVIEALTGAGFGHVTVFDGDQDLSFGGVGRSFFVAT